jgi:hypothetical protein
MTKPVTIKKPIRKRSAQSVKDHTFDLIMQRFDTVDKDNKDIKESVTLHVENDLTVHAAMKQTLDKHSTFWGLLTAAATAGMTIVVAWVNKWI